MMFITNLQQLTQLDSNAALLVLQVAALAGDGEAKPILFDSFHNGDCLNVCL